MKIEELKATFDKIKPGESAKERMLDNILNQSVRKKANPVMLPIFKKAIPALALVVVIAGGLLTYTMLAGNLNAGNPDYGLRPGSGVADDASLGREDMVAPIVNQFQIGGKHYILLSDDLRAEYGLPTAIKESDIGEKITNIATSPDKSLIGSEVYSYIPAGGEAVVAIKKDDEYRLFRFFTFESYNNNQDEDAIEYLKLYGIYGPDDIAKIQFIDHSEQSKLQGKLDVSAEITDREGIAGFYNYYSVLKNSSDKYFDRLFNHQGTGSGNKDVEIDPARTDTAVPPDAVVPDVIVPEPAEPDMITPDRIGYEDGRTKDIAPGRSDFAEDMPLLIICNDESVAVSADTPVSNSAAPDVSSSHGMMDMGGTEAGSIESSRSSPGERGLAAEALANPVTIRIYNRNGVYYDSVYYMNIGFINRYEISEEFAGFIGKYLNK